MSVPAEQTVSLHRPRGAPRPLVQRWTLAEVEALFDLPFAELLHRRMECTANTSTRR
jgi:hypothetical protein